MTSKRTYLGVEYKLTNTTTDVRVRSGSKIYTQTRPVYAIKIDGVWKLTLATSIEGVKTQIRRRKEGYGY